MIRLLVFKIMIEIKFKNILNLIVIKNIETKNLDLTFNN